MAEGNEEGMGSSVTTKKGAIVSYQFDTGALGLTTLYGVVTAAGPRSFTVRWESGLTNRRPQGDSKVRVPTNLDASEEAKIRADVARVSS